ncbi:DNA (cytosine-5-)-methyltransferase [Sphingomonas zeae]
MREVLDLFSAAAGGWSLGMHRAGFTTTAACEVEAWRRALYSENNPGVKVYDDVRTLTANRLLADLGRLPSIVVGSPPCQDISSANTKGRGVEGERSGLYFEAIRIIGEVRPRWFALENSSNLRTRGADAVIAALEAISYACWPVVVRAGDVGANHERPRCWLIGCDLAQVAHPNSNREFASPVHAEMAIVRGLGSDRQSTAEHAARVGHEGGGARRHGPDGIGAPSVAGGDAGDANGQSRPTGLGAKTAEGADDNGPGRLRSDSEHGRGRALPDGRNTPNPDQAGQADGCMVASVRQAEIADDGRGAGRSADGQGARQMGLRSPDRGDAHRSGPDWSLGHLADHLRLDDGLSARLAGTRVDVGDGKGQSAASLIVEAFGDAVIPQIPEAIGKAILRTEAALAAIYGRAAA